jgi:rSAM/selenodomain-associated transferase 1
MSKQNCLIIFTRKPELGKVKTRLAKGVGNEKALQVYMYLLEHSANISAKVNSEKQVWYTDSIQKNDVWADSVFEKHTQPKGDLGYKMRHAFQHNFNRGYQKVLIIGSDLLDLNSKNIETAFQLLENNDVVIGPAEDGGYYLLGTNHYIPEIFQNIDWSTEHVFQQTLKRIADKSLALLDKKNDIDFKEDALRHEELKKIIEK